VKLSLTALKAGLARHAQRLRFLAAGAVNTALGLTFFPALLWFSPWLYRNYMIALIISQVFCTIFAFIIYKFGVFSAGSRSLVREFFAFVSFYLFNYAINIIALPFLVKGLGMSPIIAQFGFTVALIIGSYFWHSRVTFSPGKEPS
jgi:putative flippase GtrA